MNPDGCRWCGADRYAHHQRWAPAGEQRKRRVVERRKARATP